MNSLIRLLNCRYRKQGIDPIAAGTGMAYGRALMIKAGHRGSTINEVVWMGDVVNAASNLCSNANKNGNRPLMVSNVIFDNLNEHNQKLMSKNWAHDCHHGDVINLEMDKWWQDNCQ